jgi:hypothetical protein
VGYRCQRVEPDLCSACSLPGISDHLLESVLELLPRVVRAHSALVAGRVEEPSREQLDTIADLLADAQAVVGLAELLHQAAERACPDHEIVGPWEEGAYGRLSERYWRGRWVATVEVSTTGAAWWAEWLGRKAGPCTVLGRPEAAEAARVACDHWLREQGAPLPPLEAPVDPGATRPPAPPRAQGPRGGAA